MDRETARTSGPVLLEAPEAPPRDMLDPFEERSWPPPPPGRWRTTRGGQAAAATLTAGAWVVSSAASARGGASGLFRAVATGEQWAHTVPGTPARQNSHSLPALAVAKDRPEVTE